MSVTGVGKITVEQIGNLLKRGYDKCLQKIIITNLKDGSCSAEMKVCGDHTNPMGTLHGGMSATLVDTLSSWALLSHKYGGDTSVSVDINMTYLKAAREGEDIQIDVNTLRVGKKMAFLEVLIKNKASGELLVKGAHSKMFLRG